MECIKTEALTFTYPRRTSPALRDINLTVARGEFVLLCGKSGCGKTTLLRLLKPALSPHGKRCGNISFCGAPLSSCDAKTQASEIGFVMQNPDNQLVTDKVWHELAFGLENLGYPSSEIRTRVSEMASFFGIEPWFYKNVSELSGGQKQLLNLASVMVLQPSLLILDEPTAQLDPIAAGEFLNALKTVNREFGTTVILTEHRTEEVFPMADRVVVMEEGRIIANETPHALGARLQRTDHELFFALPTPMKVHACVENHLPCPLTVRDGRAWLEEFAQQHPLDPSCIPQDSVRERDTVIELKEVHFRYEKNLPDAVKGLSLTVNKGELFCLLGGNGTGKTTALSVIAGVKQPYRGKVNTTGSIGLLPQNPESVFVKKTVGLDLELDETSPIAKLCRIEHLLDAHPYDLSGGEQERAALAKVLLRDPDILLLDEPTKGMDVSFKSEFAEILSDLKARGVTIVMVSHDIEFCAEFADRCALFFDGSITSVDTPRAFFKGKKFYTTAANRMARTLLPDAVLPQDIILACGGQVKKHKRPPRTVTHTEKAESETLPPRKLSGRTLFTLALMFLLIPLTVYLGNCFLGERKSTVISLLILLEAMLPFFAGFESRKPKARELVIISVLCALAVAGRAAFFMLPQFKPVAAIVIIAGICFGGEVGFLVGAVSGFVSNFFFGQGPWSAWQMIAFGTIGLLAGLLFRRGTSKKLPLCIFGALVTFLIYGGIMNPASVFLWQTNITWEMIGSACIAGLPFDLIHAGSTAVFLWFLAVPMIEKLERIKVKYGLIR